MCWVEAPECDAGIGGGAAPVNALMGGVVRDRPRGHLARQRRLGDQAAVEALML